jgi:hypothetical protein
MKYNQMFKRMVTEDEDGRVIYRSEIELRESLQDLIDAYIGLDCPDCGTMDAETHDVVIRARKALKEHE